MIGTLLWFGAIGILGCFSFVLLFGAPYLPTLQKQATLALDLANLNPGQTLIELGCGDGKILVAAARRGWNVVGYELNPILVAVCWLRTIRYRKQVQIHMANFLTADWPPADAIFVFSLQRKMSQLDEKLSEYPFRPVQLISFAFIIPAKKPKTQKDGLSVYRYD